VLVKIDAQLTVASIGPLQNESMLRPNQKTIDILKGITQTAAVLQ
jgi:hypothetical protein